MHETIATYNCDHAELSYECHTIFNLGVRNIEKEFETLIHYEISLNTTNKSAELRLINMPTQDWLTDISTREIIVYKLSTHFKICLEQFTA